MNNKIKFVPIEKPQIEEINIMETIYDKGFIEENMIIVGSAIDKAVINEVLQTTMKIGVQVNEEKLKNWLELCSQLQNIDRTELIDVAIKRKFRELNYKIELLQRKITELEDR